MKPVQQPGEFARPSENSLHHLFRRITEQVNRARVRYPQPHEAAEVSRDNLLAYLVLREFDLLDLQLWLAGEGLSSLGRLEGHVLASIRSVLRHLGGEPEGAGLHAPGAAEARRLLAERSQRLLGRAREGRSTRIMVTLDPACAHQHDLLEELILRGMDLVRINTAHDEPEDWEALIVGVRQAEQRLERRGRGVGRRCHVVMDLAGPKIRTGAIETEILPLKLSVAKDAHGQSLGFLEGYLDSAASSTERMVASEPGRFVLAVRGNLGCLAGGTVLNLVDSRGRSRTMTVLERVSAERLRVGLERTAWIDEGCVLNAPDGQRLVVRDLLAQPLEIRVAVGDRLRIYRDPTRLGHAARGDVPAGVTCSVPEALQGVRAGHRVFLDDGKIGAMVVDVGPEYLEIEIGSTRAGAVRIAAEKGLNFPDSELALAALTEEDRAHLPFLLEHADALGLSFAHSPQDLRDLEQALRQLGRPDFGIIAKIETSAAIHHLGQLLLTGLSLPNFGVMIARGDLAVEVGFENLALVQEDILCLCEAAHVPVVWATQVLETLAKTGLPARAEITDAAMGQRAECVMLNKGPHIAEAVEVLAELLSSEERHRIKKRQVFREFTAQAGVFEEPTRRVDRPDPALSGSPSDRPSH